MACGSTTTSSSSPTPPHTRTSSSVTGRRGLAAQSTLPSSCRRHTSLLHASPPPLPSTSTPARAFHRPSSFEEVVADNISVEPRTIDTYRKFAKIAPGELPLNMNMSRSISRKLKECGYDINKNAELVNTRYHLYFLANRMAPTVAIVRRVLTEVVRRIPDFVPKSILDFGAKTGAGLWAAAEVWPATGSTAGATFERYVNYEPSSDMAQFGQDIARDMGEELAKHEVTWTRKQSFDKFGQHGVVLAAYTLGGLHKDSLTETFRNLWKATDGVLVVIEPPDQHGFDVIHKLRTFLLEEYGSLPPEDPNAPTIVAPCPNHAKCPMAALPGQVCMFGQRILRFSLPRRSPAFNVVQHRVALGDLYLENFSYLVVRKGWGKDRKATAAAADGRVYHPLQPVEEAAYHWSRVLQPVLKRGGHVVVDLCTSQGTIERRIIPKSFPYHDAYAHVRHAFWGDLWPYPNLDEDFKQKKLEATRAARQARTRSVHDRLQQLQAARLDDDDVDEDEVEAEASRRLAHEEGLTSDEGYDVPPAVQAVLDRAMRGTPSDPKPRPVGPASGVAVSGLTPEVTKYKLDASEDDGAGAPKLTRAQRKAAQAAASIKYEERLLEEKESQDDEEEEDGEQGGGSEDPLANQEPGVDTDHADSAAAGARQPRQRRSAQADSEEGAGNNATGTATDQHVVDIPTPPVPSFKRKPGLMKHLAVKAQTPAPTAAELAAQKAAAAEAAFAASVRAEREAAKGRNITAKFDLRAAAAAAGRAAEGEASSPAAGAAASKHRLDDDDEEEEEEDDRRRPRSMSSQQPPAFKRHGRDGSASPPPPPPASTSDKKAKRLRILPKGSGIAIERDLTDKKKKDKMSKSDMGQLMNKQSLLQQFQQGRDVNMMESMLGGARGGGSREQAPSPSSPRKASATRATPAAGRRGGGEDVDFDEEMARRMMSPVTKPIGRRGRSKNATNSDYSDSD